MITASDLRMVQQKHQEQYDALKQRLSEVEAELKAEREMHDRSIGTLKRMVADQERMREALDKLERERGEFRLALVQALAMGDGVTQDAQIVAAVQESAVEAEDWIRIAAQDAQDAKTERARLLSEAWWSGRNSIRKFPPEIATGQQLQQACSDALAALSTPRQP